MAVLFNIAYEAWVEGSAPGIGPMGNPLPSATLDTQAASWAEYGRRRGIWRLMDVLGEAGIRATVFTSACLADIAPESLRSLSDAGHEIAGHGYSQHQIPALLSEDEERSTFQRCVELLASVVDTPPLGWLSPRGTPSSNTARLAVENGMIWFGDLFDDDVPHRLSTVAGSIMGIPLKMEVNDLPLHMRHGHPPSVFVDVFKDTFDAMYQRGGDGCYLDVTVHAHVFGRPHGAWTIAEIARYLSEFDDIWSPTRVELARWAEEHGLSGHPDGGQPG